MGSPPFLSSEPCRCGNVEAASSRLRVGTSDGGRVVGFAQTLLLDEHVG